MKIRLHYSFATLTLLALSALGVHLSAADAQNGPQGAPFLYRGHLLLGGSPASGTYDMSISLYETNKDGIATAGPVLNSAIKVSDGLFYVNLDFGPGPFTGTNYWLDIDVRPAGSSNTFTELGARQRLNPSPYAHSEPRLLTTVHQPGQRSQLPVQTADASADESHSPSFIRPVAGPKPAPSQNATTTTAGNAAATNGK
jgi:hypothetical protein